MSNALKNILLALMFMAIFAAVGTGSAVAADAAAEGTKQVAARLNRSGQRLLDLRQNLQQILASDASKDINSLTSQRLIMNAMSLLATRFQCEARLMGVELLIRKEYVDFYRRRRFEELSALKEIAGYTLENMKANCGKVVNNAALHVSDLGFDAVSQGQAAIDKGLKYYRKP